MKIWILNENKEPLTIADKRLVWSFKRSEYCVPVDIDAELIEYDIYREQNTLRADNGVVLLRKPIKSFSEFLQERMK